MAMDWDKVRTRITGAPTTAPVNDMGEPVRIASAIKKVESGGNYEARGASGEFGAYQFMPGTWKSWAGQYLGDSNAAPTSTNQDRVAHAKVGDLLKKGYTPRQIALIWNGGQPIEKKGVNSKGVKYDSGSYASKVMAAYGGNDALSSVRKKGIDFDAMRAKLGLTTQPTGSPTETPPEPPRAPELMASFGPGSATPAKTAIPTVPMKSAVASAASPLASVMVKPSPTPSKEPMKFPVGEGLSDVTEVLPGPRKSTLEAIKGGERVVVTPTPSKTSEKAVAEATVERQIAMGEAEQAIPKTLGERLASFDVTKDAGKAALIRQAIRQSLKGYKGERNEEATRAFAEIAQAPAFGGLDAPEIVGAKVAKAFAPEAYVAEMAAKQSAARTGPIAGIFQRAKNFVQEVKSKLVDSNAPIEDALRGAVKKNKIVLKPTEDITNQIDRVYRAPTIAGQFARDNGLERIIKEVDNLDNFDQYMIAKQARDVEAQGIKTGRDLEKDNQLIEAFSPRYEVTAQEVNAYSQKLLDYSVDAGLVSRETADALKTKYPNYVPINRIFNEIEQTGAFQGSKGVASLSKQTVVQKLKGSEREIESPLASLLGKTNDAFVQGEKNKAARQLASYEKLPDNPFQLRLLDEGEKASDKFTFSVLEDGVKKTYETTEDIARAAKALNVQTLNILGKIFALPVRVARIGITGINLPFVVSNVARDQVSAFINSKNALKTSILNPVNFVKSLFEAVGHGKMYQEMVRAGGGGTSFDIARDQVPATIKKIRAGRNPVSRILYTVRHPSELLRAVENIIGRSEELTRLQQYGGTKTALLKKGMSEEDAIAGAARAARENTVNFARRGEWGTVLNSAFLYLNASIQGTRTLIRNIAQKPLETTVKIAVAGFTPVAMATFWNLNDPVRKAIYQDIAEYEKDGNIIIIPPNPVKDEDGNWNVIKIPLSQEIKNLMALVRRPIEQAYDLDPVRAGEIAMAFLGTVSPIEPTTGSAFSTLVPQAIKPSIEAYTNKNLFTGYPQVPKSMEKLSPEMQIKETTSGTAIQIAKLLKQSPIKVEEWIKGTFGGVASQTLHASDVALAGLDIIPRSQVQGQEIIKAILFRITKARGGEMDNKLSTDLEKILLNQADERFRLKQEAEILFNELKQLPPEEATQKSNELKQKNPQLYEKLKDTVVENQKGLDYNDRLMMQLGVENGERAKFIYSEAMALETDEERTAYLNELRKKKILSDKVWSQVKYLKANPKP